MRARPTAGAVALAMVLATAAPAAAQDIPRGQFGMAAVFRKNLGDFAERFGLGYLWGFVAGYQITRPDEPLSLGLVWSTLFGRSQFWGLLGDDDPTVASGPLKYLEISLAARLRYGLSESVPLYAAASIGGSLLRTDVPVPPDEDRLHLGGFVGLGADYYVLGDVVLSLDARYGLLGDGPKGVSFMLSAALGR